MVTNNANGTGKLSKYLEPSSEVLKVKGVTESIRPSLVKVFLFDPVT